MELLISTRLLAKLPNTMEWGMNGVEFLRRRVDEVACAYLLD
jgi:hypothetical protein